MRHKINQILLFLLVFGSTQTTLSATIPCDFDHLPFSDSQKKKILENEKIIRSDVESTTKESKKRQSLDFMITGLHPKSCKFALRKLSRYENFKKYISFIKSSKYDEKNGRVSFKLSSIIFPFDMSLDFKLQRITKPGIYKFSFDKGFLKDLQGSIHVTAHGNRCLFYSTAVWEGKHTGIPNLIFEIFSATAAEISMSKLFRISTTY
jgi:hypothetical protein